MSLHFHRGDRILVIAPHPDDESLATGGLILSAQKAGAAVRVLFCTNGDNNPWPQRWVEKRWHIGHGERQRWGGRRNLEARDAIESLGLAPDSARFLHFPDQGVTEKLLTAERATLQTLCQQLQEWQPTHLVLPSPHDLHPDHNGLYVLLQVALERVPLPALRQWHFIVHCRRPELIPGKVILHLTEEERRLKRDAILQHQTQMALSQKRFLAYARPTEAYYIPDPPSASLPWHRIRHGYLDRGALTLTIALPSRRWKDITLLLAIETAGEAGQKSLRWQLPLPIISGKAHLRNTITGEQERLASIRMSGRVATIRIPLASHRRPTRIFAKLRRRMLFLDDNGWREIPVEADQREIPLPPGFPRDLTDQSQEREKEALQAAAAKAAHPNIQLA